MKAVKKDRAGQLSWTGFGWHFAPVLMALFLWSFSFSGFLTSVKSELRNRSSEYSDISDSEDSGPDCTVLVRLGPCNLQYVMERWTPAFLYVGGKWMTAFPKPVYLTFVAQSLLFSGNYTHTPRHVSTYIWSTKLLSDFGKGRGRYSSHVSHISS